jgi:hypothetical protein
MGIGFFSLLMLIWQNILALGIFLTKHYRYYYMASQGEDIA